MVPAVLAVIARGVRMADQEGVAQPAAQPELPIGEPEALQPAAPLEEEQAQHVEDFLAQELEEADWCAVLGPAVPAVPLPRSPRGGRV